MPLILPHPITPTLTAVSPLMVKSYILRFQAKGIRKTCNLLPFSSARPEHAAFDYLSGFWHVEVFGYVAQGAVEDASLAPLSLPDDGYYVALDPGYVLSREGGGRQNPVGGIDVHVVLLGVHLEVVEARGYGVFVVNDVDLVVDYLAGVGHPLAAHHELVVDAVAERVGHAAVPACKPEPALYGAAQALLLLVRDLPHRPDRDYEVKRPHLLPIEVGVEGRGDLHLVPILFEDGREDGGALLGFVALPTTADEEGGLHTASSLMISCMETSRFSRAEA